jgi:hypothetical protein
LDEYEAAWAGAHFASGWEAHDLANSKNLNEGKVQSLKESGVRVDLHSIEEAAGEGADRISSIRVIA